MEDWRSQMFYVRAEDKTTVGDNFVEIKLPLEHILSIIQILYKQKRNVTVGRNFLNLLMASNPRAIDLLERIGFVEFKRVSKGKNES